jgi:predicted acetylornithine/succinylornithine family transaminase
MTMSRNEEIAALFNQHVMPTYSPSVALVRGKGTRVWDADGKVYLDFLAGIAVLNVGHCHPRVVDAIGRQAAQLMHVSNLYYTENEAKLAQKLSDLSLKGKVFFANSGAEANEALIKLARLWGHDSGRYEVICMKNSFHGRTLATAAATGQEKIQKGFEPMPEGFRHAVLNDIESVKALVTDKTAAVMVEAVQGEGGIVAATDEFMRAVRSLCDEKNLLMLCDEVQCGMGRTGHWFAFQASGVQPDAFSLAKSLGSGFPIGAAVAGPKLADVFKPGSHASTFGGTPLACAAALATIETIEEEGLVDKARRAGDLFREGLEGYIEQFEHVKEVRGRGLMLGLVLDQPAKALVDSLREGGLLAVATAGNVVRFLPPLNVKDGELEEALDIIHDALSEMHGVAPQPEAEAEPAPAEGAASAAAAEAPAAGAGAQTA